MADTPPPPEQLLPQLGVSTPIFRVAATVCAYDSGGPLATVTLDTDRVEVVFLDEVSTCTHGEAPAVGIELVAVFMERIGDC